VFFSNSLVDWNSIVNSKHGITDSYNSPYGKNSLPFNEFGILLNHDVHSRNKPLESIINILSIKSY